MMVYFELKLWDSQLKYFNISVHPADCAAQVGTYSGGGATQNLNSLKNESALIIKELKEGLWIGRATRVVFVDFTVYNANINLFCVVKLVFEFPATGGGSYHLFASLVIPSSKQILYLCIDR